MQMAGLGPNDVLTECVYVLSAIKMTGEGYISVILFLAKKCFW